MYTSGTTGMPKGIRAHALHPRDVRAHDGQRVAARTRVGGAAHGRADLQRCDGDDVARLHVRRHVHPAPRLRPGAVHRHGGARTGHAHDAGAVADHRDPERPRVRRGAARVARDRALARRAVAQRVQGPVEPAAARPLLRALRPDRGLRDDPRPRRRAAQERQRGRPAAVLRDAHPGRGRARTAGRGSGRDRRAGADHDAGLLPAARPHGDRARRRLAALRRLGLRRRGGVSLSWSTARRT